MSERFMLSTHVLIGFHCTYPFTVTHSHTQSERERERETAEDSHTCTHKRHLQKMSVANTQTDTRTTRGRACVPHNNKNLFSTFYLSQPAVARLPPPSSHLPPSWCSPAIRATLQHSSPSVQRTTWTCRYVHTYTYYYNAFAQVYGRGHSRLNSTRANRTERNKIASENKNTTCHTPMPPSPRPTPRPSMLCELCTTVLCSCKRTNMCV